MTRRRLESTSHLRSLDDVKLAEGSDHIAGQAHFFGGGSAEAGDDYPCTVRKVLAVRRDEPRRFFAERNHHIRATIRILGRKISGHSADVLRLRKSRKIEKFGEEIDPSFGRVEQTRPHGLSGRGRRGYSFVIWVENENTWIPAHDLLGRGWHRSNRYKKYAAESRSPPEPARSCPPIAHQAHPLPREAHRQIAKPRRPYNSPSGVKKITICNGCPKVQYRCGSPFGRVLATSVVRNLLGGSGWMPFRSRGVRISILLQLFRLILSE
ncbi:hypothetical protein D9M68_643320 [compost metagenome]